MVMPMHHTSAEGVEDMAVLGDLHEAAILYNIQQRYCNNKIYVSRWEWERGKGVVDEVVGMDGIDGWMCGLGEMG